ncbi:MAG TPA: MlaD family protein [Azospirillum sp.]
METRASYILVGSFVLALLAGLFVFSIWIAKVQLEQSRDTYYIFFTGSVTGLQTGSPVRYRGIPVGTVTDLRLDPSNVGQVRVTVELQEETPIKVDSIAALEMQGITGGAFVQITGGTERSERLKDSEHRGVPVIPSRPSTLSEVVESAPRLLARILELTNRAAELLSNDNQMALGETLQNVRTLTTHLATAANGLEKTLEKVDGVLPHLDQTVVQAGRTLGTLETSTKQLSGDARELSQALTKTSAQVNAMLAENRAPVHDFTTTGLYEFTLLITQLRDLSGQVSRVVTRLENDPSNFLFGGTRQGVEVRGK